MPDPLTIQVRDGDRLVFEAVMPLPIEIGRQRSEEAPPLCIVPATVESAARLVIAKKDESNCSRRHLRIDRLSPGKLRITNLSQISVPIDDGRHLEAKCTAELSSPFRIHLASRTISVFSGDAEESPGIFNLDHPTMPPSQGSERSRILRQPPSLSQPLADEIIAWLQTTMGVLQSCIGSVDFLAKAAEGIVRIAGLDSGRVLLFNGEGQRTAAYFGPPSQPVDWKPSQFVLERLRRERKTFWQHPKRSAAAESPSLAKLHTVVAAPILDAAGNAIGALYGERLAGPVLDPAANGKFEALLLELLACGVSSGLARQEGEKAALEARVRFEQFFGPHLAEQLVRDPRMLDGRQAVVTLLFCDVRGFSSISERLGPSRTMLWMNDAMTTLSEAVLAQEGVLADYIGDELFAMWGAPREQYDQAPRAIRAALAMLDCVDTLNARWRDVLGGEMDIGIGINTGTAQVGNTGSRMRFKYGPLGNSVNIASRVQGLTKYLKCRLLVTAETRMHLGEAFLARRVCRTRVMNIDVPIELYEVRPPGTEEDRKYFAESEAALDALEQGDYAQAARRAGTLLLNRTGDGPLLNILSRAANALMGGIPFDPIWEPPGK